MKEHRKRVFALHSFSARLMKKAEQNDLVPLLFWRRRGFQKERSMMTLVEMIMPTKATG